MNKIWFNIQRLWYSFKGFPHNNGTSFMRCQSYTVAKWSGTSTSIELLIKAAKADRDARVEAGINAIDITLNDKTLESQPEVRKYLNLLNAKINEPKVLDVLDNLTSTYMAHGSISDKEIKEALESVL